MKYQLRDYQQRASDAAVSFFRNTAVKTNAIIVLPTGSGKSLVIADIARQLDAPTLIFQPSKEILEQNYAKLQSYGFWDASIYSASFNSKEIRRITFATIGSVKSNPELFKAFRYAIIDECHLVNPKEGMYKTFFEVVNCKILGLTATPYRLHSSQEFGAMLKFITRTRPRIFTNVLCSVQVDELSRRGYLSVMKYYPMKESIDRNRLKRNSTGRDYTDESVLQEYTRSGFYGYLCNIIQRLLNVNRRGILVFTRFLQEAEQLKETFFECCAIVSGDTPKTEREQILKDFKAGNIKVVANVGVLTTGFDYPELDTVVLARPTMSLALYYQMVGRAIRPHRDKPESWIVDLCGNYNRFGRVEDLKLTEPKAGMYQIESGGRPLTGVYF